MAARPDIDKKSGTARLGTQDGELEQYGVWVKAEPQDILPEPEQSTLGRSPTDAFDDSEFDIPSIGDALPEESFLSAEEERLLGSFEELEASEPSAEASGGLDSEDFTLPDIEDLSSSEPQADVPDLSVEELPVETIEPGALPDISPNAVLDMSSIVGLKESALPMEKHDAGSTEEQLLEDVSADFLDLEAESPLSESSEGTGEAADVTAEFLDLEESPSPSKAGASPISDVTDDFLTEDAALVKAEAASASIPEEVEFESLDIDLHFDETLPGAEGLGGAEAGFDEVSAFDDILKDEAPAAHPHHEIDDLAAVERELAAPAAPPARSEPSHAQAESPSLATELLLKIATELSSIRSELVTIKSQFNAIRPEAAAAPEPSQPPAPSPDEAEVKAGAGGFFDEEEDETIALTGDELDNILSSADFTEEAPPEEAAPEEGRVETAELLSEPSFELPAESVEPATAAETESLADLLPESGDYSAPIEEIRLEPSEETLEIPEPEEALDIHRLAEDGVQPFTEAPDDTSYLEEEALSSEEPLDLGETPIVEAPLVEPDLSAISLDEIEPLEELDISEELPVAEEEALPDLSIEPLPGMSEAFTAEEEAELEPLAGIPEVEEFSLADIELAGEDRETQPVVLEPEEEEFAELLEEEAVKTPSPPEETTMAEEPLLSSFEPETELTSTPHPDELSLQLDDSFFVTPEEAPAAEQGLEPPAVALAAEAAMETTPVPAATPVPAETPAPLPTDRLKNDIRNVLAYLDKLLESLPEEKIEEFAHSEHFDTYKKLFEELGLV